MSTKKMPRYPFTYQDLDQLLGWRSKIVLPRGRNLTLRRNGDYLEICSYRTPIVVIDRDQTTIRAYNYSRTTNSHADALNLYHACFHRINNWVIEMGTCDYPLVIKRGTPVLPDNIEYILGKIETTILDSILNLISTAIYVSLRLHKNYGAVCSIRGEKERWLPSPFKTKTGRQIREQILQLFQGLPVQSAKLVLDFNSTSPMQRLSWLYKQTLKTEEKETNQLGMFPVP